MGHSHRGLRKKFAAKKVKDHFTRANWSGSNGGVRLRSLSADLAEFEALRLEDRALSASQEASPPTKSAPKTASLEALPAAFLQFFELFSVSALEKQMAFAQKQAKHLGKIISLLAWEPGGSAAIGRLQKTKKRWDRETGTLGGVIRAKREGP